MAGVKISLTAPAGAAEALSEGMLELGAQSVSLRSAHSGGDEVLEPPPKSMPLWHRVSVTGLFPVTVDVAQVATELEGGEGIEIDWLQQQDWSQTWRARAPTLSFGERLMVMPRGAPPPKGFPGAVLRSDPGLAFGSGAHPTTRLCLSWLAEADLAGAAVLDYGCGAGILGIAAALLGANQVIAVDQDPQALIATKRNARHNNVTLDAVLPPQDVPKAAKFDVVIANILVNPLVALALRLTNALRPSGHLVLSGVLANQVGAVAAAYPQVNFTPPTLEDDWVRLAGVLRP